MGKASARSLPIVLVCLLKKKIKCEVSLNFYLFILVIFNTFILIFSEIYASIDEIFERKAVWRELVADPVNQKGREEKQKQKLTEGETSKDNDDEQQYKTNNYSNIT